MEKKQRIKYFAFYPDDFLDDDRFNALSPKEQGQWLLLLTHMFRFGGEIVDAPDFIARLLGLQRNEAVKLKTRLLALRLLTQEYDKLVSKRLREEYHRAKKACQQRSEAGKKGADAKWTKVVDFPSDRYGDR